MARWMRPRNRERSITAGVSKAGAAKTGLDAPRPRPCFANGRAAWLGCGLTAVLILTGSAAWAEKPEPVRKPPRGDICAETPPFVAMEMLSIPIIRDGIVGGILNVKPCFATTDAQTATVTRALPTLQDHYVRRLHRYASLRVDPKRPIDLRGLRALLQEDSDAVLGQKIPVLITFVALRQLG